MTDPQSNDLPKLAAPARRALQGAGINNLEQLAEFAEAELLALHGMGPNALEKLHAALQASGLSFRESRKKLGSEDFDEDAR